MIISKTPMRVSFCGGGTDLEEFYKNETGAITSTAINRYVYITVNEKFDNDIRLSYSKTENVKHVDEVEHNLLREAMKLTGVVRGVEVTSMADIPSRGTGLGSSSSFTVGLLNALYSHMGQHKSAESLARDACKIEIDLLKEPIGKQDQYIAAYGGFKHISFNPDGEVFVEPIVCKKSTKEELQENLLMFYTGITRKANSILSEQKANSEAKRDILSRMGDLSVEFKDTLNSNDLGKIGALLHKNWIYKKKLSLGITTPLIDEYYEKALNAGASGGKILGAGGGGFLLLYCEKQKQNKVFEVLKDIRHIPFKFEAAGSRLIYIEDN